MKTDATWRRAGILPALFLFIVSADAALAFGFGHRDRGRRDAPFIQLRLSDRVVHFQQVSWELENVSLPNSSWGQFDVRPDALKRRFGKDSGYVNVLLYPDSGGRDSSCWWAVENMLVAPPPCPPNGWGADSSNRPSRRQPACRYFDLNPDRNPDTGAVENARRLPWLRATVVVSGQPLPVSEESMRFLKTFAPRWFPIRPVVDNAEGFLPDPELNTRPPRTVNELFPLGLPPQPLTPVPNPDLDLLFPLCVFQTDGPNVQCAKNQCVPMAQANTILYLEQTFNIVPLIWSLPELGIPGIGRINSAGDVLFWEPVPENSVVANVDFFTRRLGVLNPDTGSGSDICQLFRGLFGYLEAAEPFTAAEFMHYGTNSAVIGDGAACDTITIDLGGRQSPEVGDTPTWQAMFNNLSAGRGVSICFGRYDADGERTSGHCVRVYGACRFGSLFYIYTLDDGNQGSNNSGLRTQVWQVEDTGGPGDNPGAPDGRLNMDGMSWEIEFMNVIEAKPTLAIP